eukprot:NODE_7008_length_800_cov_116.345643_g6770_i0.p1 GENE.NODE_7008_length_800_cov_116.345643_g6770_i0~~NODE_7008_length_800_cov_116.345643_g6770_i0.p1  ORF type:complete len:215 (-),score=42.79 NODE_7008_length_800_cov_116.345643_g6770_i0:156-749(-)
MSMYGYVSSPLTTNYTPRMSPFPTSSAPLGAYTTTFSTAPSYPSYQSSPSTYTSQTYAPRSSSPALSTASHVSETPSFQNPTFGSLFASGTSTPLPSSFYPSYTSSPFVSSSYCPTLIQSQWPTSGAFSSRSAELDRAWKELETEKANFQQQRREYAEWEALRRQEIGKCKSCGWDFLSSKDAEQPETTTEQEQEQE